MTLVILVAVKWAVGLRVDEDQETIGLDVAEHGERIP
jgi:ammonia channel protein AmtB